LAQVAEQFIKRYEDGQLIFAEGEAGHEMFVVMSGAVDIVKKGAGDDAVVASLGTGEMFGEIALVAGGKRSASAIARGQDTQVVLIDQARFVYLVSQQPAFALSVMRMMALRLAGATPDPRST
jgi:CRP/FNR family cyclic AMP-dependent transcriptional regulator